MKSITYSLFFGILLFITCDKAPSSSESQPKNSPYLPAAVYDYNNTNSNEKLNNDLATLGRVLFYDKKLSHNTSVSCGSCHKQNLAFADNQALSQGFSGLKTKRNSLAIINLNKFNSLFWDARENILDSMVIKPILNHIEMGISDMASVVSRINQYPYYQDLFKKAYGKSEINEQLIGRALAEFVKSIRNTDGFQARVANIKSTEGAKLFQKYQCSNCHNVGNIENTSWGASFANTGLDLIDKDKGVGESQKFKGDFFDGAFKIPSLINVGLSAPYMHDGRFKTLEEVIDHYSHGINANKNLDFRLQEGMENLLFIGSTSVFTLNQSKISAQGNIKPRQSKITATDKKILVDFLKSLTDQQLITDRKYSDPFLY